MLRLRSDWITGTPAVTYKKGSLIAANLDAFMQGKREFQVIFEPTRNSSLSGFSGSKNRLFLDLLTDVRSQVLVFSRKPGDTSKTRWVGTPLKETVGSIGVVPADPHRSDDTWLWLEDFTVPPTLLSWNPVDAEARADEAEPRVLRRHQRRSESALRRSPKTALEFPTSK